MEYPDGADPRTLYPVRWWHRAGAVAGLATLLFFAGGETAAARIFYLQTPRLGADFAYSFRDVKQTTPQRESQITGHRFLEGVNLATRGYLYHPALFLFDLNLAPTWEQQQETYGGRDTARRSLFLDYGFSGTLFQERMLSLRLMANRSTSTTSTSLNPSSSSENTAYSAGLRYRSRKLPTTLNYVRREQSQEGFYSSTQVGDKLTLRTDNKSERQVSSLRAEHEKQQRQERGLTQDRQSYRVNLSNNLKLTADKRMVLQSTLQSRWLELQDQESSNLSIDERLSWRHTERDKPLQIQSEYSARYNVDSRDGERREHIPMTAAFSLSHLLYENLVSSLDADTAYSKFGDGEVKKYGASYNFAYNRRVPIGMVSLNHGQSYQMSDTSTLPDTIPVTGELLSFDGLGFAQLAIPDVVEGTVELFDAEGFPYGSSDYNIVKVGGGFFAVEWVFFSDLYTDVGNGKQVTINYRYHSDPSARVESRKRTFGVGLGLGSALTLGYQLTRHQDRQRDGAPIHSLADDTLQQVSAQLSYGWSATEVSYNDSQRAADDSSRSWLARQTFSWRPRPAIALALRGSYRKSELLDTGESGENYSLETSGQWQPRANLRWQVAATHQTSTSKRPDRIDTGGLPPKFLDTDISGYSLKASGQWQPRANRQWRFAADHQTRTTNRPDNTETKRGLELEYLLRYRVWQLEAKYRHLLNQQSLSGQERSENLFNLTLRRQLR